MDIIAEAKKLFNETWDLLDKTDRTPEDDITMLHKAHTSCYLWRSAENPVNNARGEWQVSHVYSILNMGVPALLHGKQSLGLCLDNGIGDLDLVFGYEAVARACSVLGNLDQAKENITKGLAACEAVTDENDRNYARGELENIAV